MKKGLRLELLVDVDRLAVFTRALMKKGLRLEIGERRRTVGVVFTRALMKKGLRRAAEELMMLRSAVFTRALMKKGLRPKRTDGFGIVKSFHACPDEEGITTQKPLRLRPLAAAFSRVP